MKKIFISIFLISFVFNFANAEEVKKNKTDEELIREIQELVKQENKVESIDEINGPQIILGSLEEVTLTGNWPKKYGNNE